VTPAFLAGLSHTQANMAADILAGLESPLATGQLTRTGAAQALEALAFHLRLAPGTGLSFELEADFKPYVRMTQVSKFADPQAREYLASKGHLAAQMWRQLDGRAPADGDSLFPRSRPLAVRLEIAHSRGFHNKDLDNQVKAVLDAAQAPHGPLYHNDNWIDYIQASRRAGAEDIARLAIGALDSAG